MTMVFDVLPAMLAAGTALSAAAGTAGAATAVAGAATASTGLFGAGILTAGNVFAGVTAATALYKAVDLFTDKGPDPMKEINKLTATTPRNLPGEANLKRIKEMKKRNTVSESGGLLNTSVDSETQKLGSG